jgi:hypothetical protein
MKKTRKLFIFILERPPRNTTSATNKPSTDDNMSPDDGVSTCSNVSEGTTNYDDVEGRKN